MFIFTIIRVLGVEVKGCAYNNCNIGEIIRIYGGV
jgi:hypothetical protein